MFPLVLNKSPVELITITSPWLDTAKDKKFCDLIKDDIERISQIFEPLKNNKDVLLRVDVQGAKRIKELIPDVVLIFIKPEKTESLRQRLIERGVNTTTEMTTRLKTAEREIQTSDFFEFIIVNKDGDVQYAVKKVLNIIKDIKN